MARKEFFKDPSEGELVTGEELEAHYDAIKRLTTRSAVPPRVREASAGVHTETNDELALARRELQHEPQPEAVKSGEVAMPEEIMGSSVPSEMLDQLHAYLLQEQADVAPSQELLRLYPDIQAAESFEEIDAMIIDAWAAYRALKVNLGRSRIDAQAASQLRARATRVRAALVQKELMLANPPQPKQPQSKLKKLLGSIFR